VGRAGHGTLVLAARVDAAAPGLWLARFVEFGE
jgi:hypothetical protein